MTRTAPAIFHLACLVTITAYAQTPEWRSQMEHGNASFISGNFDEATVSFRRAVKLSDTPAANPLELASALSALASAEDELTRFMDSEQHFKRAVAVAEEAAGRNSVARARILVNFTGVYVHQDQYARAEKLSREAVEIYSSLEPADSTSLAVARNCLGEILLWQKEFPEAGAVLDQALAALESEAAPRPEYAMCLNNLGMVRRSQGRNDEAITLLQKALAIMEQERGAGNPVLVNVLNNLAIAQLKSGRRAEGEATFARAIQIADAHPGGAQNVEDAILRNYAECLKSMGRKGEAKKLEARAAVIARERARSNGSGLTVDVMGLRAK